MQVKAVDGDTGFGLGDHLTFAGTTVQCLPEDRQGRARLVHVVSKAENSLIMRSATRPVRVPGAHDRARRRLRLFDLDPVVIP